MSKNTSMIEGTMSTAVTRLPQQQVAPLDYTSRQLATIKQTIAKDCNGSEFDLLIEFARFKRLSLITKQVIPLVFSKDNAEKRRMSIVVTQDGLRALASRTHDYRPAEKEPDFTIDESLKSLTNPIGIEKCSTILWKQDQHSKAWHPVNGWAYWSEMAPVADEWAYDQEAGKRKPTGKKTLEGNWAKMPRIMINKCAVMQALRAGWPDVYDGIYLQEELDRERFLDLTATEIVEHDQEERRAKAIAMSSDEIPTVSDQGILAFIPAGRFCDYFLGLARSYSNRQEYDDMMIRNREGFQRFWVAHKNDALDLREQMEKIAEKLPKQVAAQ
jgi:phage recombination protein Bet